MEAVDKSPEEAGKEDVVAELFLLAEFLIECFLFL